MLPMSCQMYFLRISFFLTLLHLHGQINSKGLQIQSCTGPVKDLTGPEDEHK